jgi:hypothetical protein
VHADSHRNRLRISITNSASWVTERYFHLFPYGIVAAVYLAWQSGVVIMNAYGRDLLSAIHWDL